MVTYFNFFTTRGQEYYKVAHPLDCDEVGNILYQCHKGLHIDPIDLFGVNKF